MPADRPLGSVTVLPAHLRDYYVRELEDEQARLEFDAARRDRWVEQGPVPAWWRGHA